MPPASHFATYKAGHGEPLSLRDRPKRDKGRPGKGVMYLRSAVTCHRVFCES